MRNNLTCVSPSNRRFISPSIRKTILKPGLQVDRMDTKYVNSEVDGKDILDDRKEKGSVSGTRKGKSKNKG